MVWDKNPRKMRPVRVPKGEQDDIYLAQKDKIDRDNKEKDKRNGSK